MKLKSPVQNTVFQSGRTVQKPIGKELTALPTISRSAEDLHV
jgi:hypothetical protein